MNLGERRCVPFTRDMRLTRGVEFRRVFDHARRSSDKFFTVLGTRNTLGRARLGMAIGKKRVRRAVARNRIKRRIRESFRRHAHEIDAVDLVVISRFDGRASNQDIDRSLARHWHRFTSKSD